jgi:hypothetical protein
MSFWTSELGEITGNPEDAFAKTFTQIPDGTMALAKIETFKKMADKEGNTFFNVEWLITDGDFRGSKVNQKLKVWGDPRDKDPARTIHRALNMFRLLYQLFKIQPKHSNEPTDEELLVFVGKVAGIKIRETEPNDKGLQYNWVSEVHSSVGFKCETGISMVVTHTHGKQDDPLDSAFSRHREHLETKSGQLLDDIPF